MPSRKPKKRTAADKVVASTAGQDSWKTWAGRRGGTDDFEVMDIFRGLQRTVQQSLFTNIPPPGTTCPVCFCEPESRDEWHVTSSCSHAVCLDCFRAFAANQVKDKEQSGPLKCPVCAKVLRTKDAMVAFESNPELVNSWDIKIRNQLLRALPAFRSCPSCSGDGEEESSEDNSEAVTSARVLGRSPATDMATSPLAGAGGGSNGEGVNGGGGFVTPECLAPHYQERRGNALRILERLSVFLPLLLAGYVCIVVVICANPSSSPLTDLFFMVVVSYPLIRVAMFSRSHMAQKARDELIRPISVGCPCCGKDFLLPTEMTQNMLGDEETSRWINARTRPCPSCSAPIEKDGGCNHMRCGKCNASFCWACMRLRTTCASYSCNNGAPFNNAVPGVGGRQPQATDDTLVSAIESVLSSRMLPSRPLGRADAAVVVFAIFARFLSPVQTIVEAFMEAIAVCFGRGALMWIGIFMLMNSAIETLLRRFRRYRDRMQLEVERQRPRHGRGRRQPNQDHSFGGALSERILMSMGQPQQNGIPQNNHLRRRRGRMMTEQQMIDEAIRRSLQDEG